MFAGPMDREEEVGQYMHYNAVPIKANLVLELVSVWKEVSQLPGAPREGEAGTEQHVLSSDILLNLSKLGVYVIIDYS